MPNDISFDKNIILTGPNAGGKSTIIKSTMISVLMAQTIGLVAAKSMVITPFSYIGTQINVPDSKGHESLFEAEMHRSKENLEIAKNNTLSLLAMDEIFNSTNPIEGISGAYAIAKKLGSIPNCKCIISTHYLYLSRLVKEGTFKSMKMNVVLDDVGNVKEYPYKLSKGVSRQYIALELLRENGFDDDIITEALAIKKKLSSIASTPITVETPQNACVETPQKVSAPIL